jgi:ATP-dependent protease HslVU (ClpYQ) ATPase subunit
MIRIRIGSDKSAKKSAILSKTRSCMASMTESQAFITLSCRSAILAMRLRLGFMRKMALNMRFVQIELTH